ncbi:MAG: HD domain-containing protein [Chloroflexi bacterium]|nr:HD domain-containing protein [Chloroflexota bacterium]
MAELRLDLRGYPVLQHVLGLLQGKRVAAYITGGFVRDLLLGRSVRDIDLSLGADPREMARLTADALQGSYVLVSDVADRQVGRVVLPEVTLDFTPLRGTIEEDLAQRDFSIDALALDLSQYPQAALADPWGGLADIRGRQVRALGPEVFLEDPVRLLRGPRLVAELDFSLEPATASAIREHASLLTQASAERLREELCKLLAVPEAAPHIFLLDDLGLLSLLFPEMEEGRGVEQPPEHHWDVFRHSLEAVAAVERLLERKGPANVIGAVPWSPDLEGHFAQAVSSGHHRSVLLKLAALLHDIAKPQKRMVDESGRMHFYGHAREGAIMAQAVMERLRFSAREARMVSQMVEHHLRPRQMVSQDDPLPTARAIYRYFRDVGDVAIDTLFLNLADHWASRGPDLVREDWREHARIVAYVLEQWQQQAPAVSPPRLVTGHDIMRELGLEPGPLVGELLEEVKEAQASGQVRTREEALAWARQHLSRATPLPELTKERQ